jgi:hypothetical protein
MTWALRPSKQAIGICTQSGSVAHRYSPAIIDGMMNFGRYRRGQRPT